MLMTIRRAGIALPLILISACSMRGCGGARDASSAVPPGTTAAATAPPPAGSSLPAALDDKALAEASSFLAKSAAAPEPATSSVDQAAAAAGSDPAALFAFVHDRIRTEIYRGVLRGAAGTLMGGAGNAWDQSLLLAAMLHHHGRDVRFAHVHLAPDAAAKIVDRMFADAARPRTPAALPVAPPDVLQQQGRALVARIDADGKRAGADLLEAVDRAHLTLGDQAATAQTLAAEAADHLFVEYRDGDNWVALDPAGAAAPGASAGAAEERFAGVPDSAAHHVTIRVWIEQRKNHALDKQVVFRYPATAAELYGEPVVLRHRIDRDATGRWRATPMLQAGRKFYAARTFDETGLVGAMANTKEDLIGQAHDAVKGLGAVTDAFGGGDAKPAAAASELTAEWLEVEFTDPAKQAVVVRRDLVDRIGVVARANGSAATAALPPIPVADGVPVPFAGVYACAFAPGPLDPARPIRRVSAPDRLMADLRALRGAQAGASGLAAEDHQRLARVIDALPAVLAAAAENALVVSQRLAARSLPPGASPIFYEASPRLVIASVDPIAGGALDFRRYAMRAAGRQMAGDALAKATLARAAGDAAIESALLNSDARPPANGTRLAALDVFERARADGIHFVTVRSGEPLNGIEPTDVSRARMAAAEPGRVLIAPERTPSAAPPRFAWWLVDPSTGDAVTVLDSGLHGAQDMPEYAKTQQISELAFDAPPPNQISPMAYEIDLPPGWAEVKNPWAKCIVFTDEMLLELMKAIIATGP